MPARIRIGLIGAGAFTTNRMLPNLQKLPDVEVTTIANRRRSTAEKVADQFGIPEVADDFTQVIASPNVDAVLIGTPPYLHKEATLAALEAGKHVLCQTRISTSAAEAREMEGRARGARARGVRTMLVPPAPWYRGSRFVDHLMESGFLGRLRHVMAFNMNASFADPQTPLSAGRNDRDVYGPFNAAQLGLTYDVIARWAGYARSVVAQRATFTEERPLTPDGPIARVPFPDEVTVVAETERRAVAMVLMNYASHFSDSRIELYGSEGTVIYRQKGDAILAGRAGDAELKPLPIPDEYDNPWRIEAEFMQLVRGEIEEPSFSFRDGVRSMEYLEAAYYAATEGRRVALP
ncbi:MAG TPA: Gfo/Idh/MocA family oxidoreductase [Dehalococcoidia bacterium]|nr:Gfo/Idh/MocA family oxidoreductase [Dehalococcoidia bacterium]